MVRFVADYRDGTFGDLSKRACLAQMHQADRRGISFVFTYAEWLAWWLDQLGRLGDGAQRGRRRDQYVMARLGDKGAYEVGNVMCIRPKQNHHDRDPASVMAAIDKIRASRESNGKPLGAHLRVRGDGHPRSKAVVTEDGRRFGSLALAAEAYGITRQAGGHRVKRGRWTLESRAGSTTL